MRLIDADDINILNDFCCCCHQDVCDGEMRGTIQECEIIRHFLDVIDDTPTAYDIDKVVQQLEALKKYTISIGDMVCDIQENGTSRHFVCLEDAIEIVKKGGK